MNVTLTRGNWWRLLLAAYLILVALALLFSLAVPALLLGLVALAAGVCCLLGL